MQPIFDEVRDCNYVPSSNVPLRYFQYAENLRKEYC